jgi:hypothetical protein
MSSGQTVSTAAPYFLSDLFEDGGFKHVTMDRLQFGQHQQPAANNARLIGKALATSSLWAELLSLFIDASISATE